MRFTQQLLRSQVPHWAEAYTDYPGLKAFLDKETTSLTDVKDTVLLNTDAIQDFFDKRSRDIQRQISLVEARWGIHPSSANAVSFQGVCQVELQNLEGALVEIAANIVQLQGYMKINHEALSRICQKAVAVTAGATPAQLLQPLRIIQQDSDTRCAALLSPVNISLTGIHGALQSHDGGTGRSLLLERPPKLQFPAQVLDMLCGDDAVALGAALDAPHSSQLFQDEAALSRLLHAAIIRRSYACQGLLLSKLRSNPERTLSSDEDYLHCIVKQLGLSRPLSESQPPVDYFGQILKLLQPCHLPMLQLCDSLGRLPIHYAAELGLEDVCREILANVPGPDRHAMVLDAAGQTSLDCAVNHGRTAVVEILIQTCKLADNSKTMDQSDLLVTAILSYSHEISMRLISEKWGVGFVSKSGKTALHMAAEQGLADVTKAILGQLTNPDPRDYAKGLTPLAAACIRGRDETVSILLQAGADTNIRDSRGWLPKDHAAYRGHPKVFEAITTSGSKSLAVKPKKRRGRTNILPRCPATNSVIFLALGTLDLYKHVPDVDLAPYRRKVSPAQAPDTGLVLSITLEEEGAQEYRVPLPVVSDESDWPRCFTTSHPSSATIIFEVLSTAGDELIGTGVALLASLKGGLGPKRESLVRDFTIPLISSRYGHVGAITFTFVIALPFAAAHGMSPASKPQELKHEARTMLGGHRGNGQNDKAHRHLQAGENSVQSFRTAVDHGADVVEFDVQITKDDIPVVYHDFLVVEKGMDATMHTLTHDEFMAINAAQSGTVEVCSPKRRLPWDERERPRVLDRQRRRSLCAPVDTATDALVSQMERALNYPGHKGNLRNENIHEPFVTLEQTFRSLPEDVILDIEIKYPMLYEATDFGMDTFAPELNHFLDTILAVIYMHAGPRRRIIFSAFSPEVCMVLAVKQKTYPILFLNDSSNWPTGDLRATSTQTAARFAHRFGLAGVVMESGPFIASPGLVGFLKDQGLYTSTYGHLNDNVECAKIQAEAGLDLIIVNKVKYIKNALGL